MHPRRDPPVAPLVRLGVFLAVALLALTPPATAQAELPPCTVLECSFDVSIVDWNGTGEPGTFLTGTIRITNTGQSEDEYSVNASADNETWVAGVDPEATGTVAPGDPVLPSEGNASVDVAVLVFVPDAARAGDTASVRITVASVNDDELEEQDVVLATEALQVYAWSLSCTDAIEIEKARSGTIELIATNRGNGFDDARVTTAPLAGLQVPELEPFALGAGDTSIREVELGVGISLEDGDYALRWDLVSTERTSATASCTTTLNVTGGEPEPTDDGETEDGPAPGAAFLLIVLAGLLIHRRRTGRSN